MNNNQSDQFKIEKASILVSDLKGFTYFSEKHSTLEVAELLSRYFSAMIPIIEAHGGIVEKLIGDSTLTIFPCHDDDITPVLSCAIDMQNVMAAINHENQSMGLSSIHMGIGINTGDVAVGYLGGNSHQEYTAIGNEVNLAARVEAYSMRGQILVSDNSYSLCHENIEVGNTYAIQPKGTLRPLKIYELLAVKNPEKHLLEKENDRSEPRLNVAMPISYRLIDKSKTLSETFTGEAIDISYKGLKIKSRNHLEALSEVLLEVNSSIFYSETSSAYAKVKYSSSVDDYYISGLEFTTIDDAALLAIKTFIDNSI